LGIKLFIFIKIIGQRKEPVKEVEKETQWGETRKDEADPVDSC